MILPLGFACLRSALDTLDYPGRFRVVDRWHTGGADGDTFGCDWAASLPSLAWLCLGAELQNNDVKESPRWTQEKLCA